MAACQRSLPVLISVIRVHNDAERGPWKASDWPRCLGSMSASHASASCGTRRGGKWVTSRYPVLSAQQSGRVRAVFLTCGYAESVQVGRGIADVAFGGAAAHQRRRPRRGRTGRTDGTLTSARVTTSLLTVMRDKRGGAWTAASLGRTRQRRDPPPRYPSVGDEERRSNSRDASPLPNC